VVGGCHEIFIYPKRSETMLTASVTCNLEVLGVSNYVYIGDLKPVSPVPPLSAISKYVHKVLLFNGRIGDPHWQV
jgi:hypothetical protein